MKVLLVRHGETVQNKATIVQGSDPTQGRLTEWGVRQAHLLAVALRNHAFDIAYCSPLERCVLTLAQILLERPGERTLPLVFHNDLREVNLGVYQGRPRAEWNAAAGDNVANYRAPQAESWHDLQLRVGALLRHVILRGGHRNVLVVAHGGVNRGMVADVLGLSIGDLFAGQPRGLSQGNTCVNLLEFSPAGELTRLIVNDTRHLQAEVPDAGPGLLWNFDRGDWEPAGAHRALADPLGEHTGP